LLLQRKLAEEELEKSKELQASQGFLLKNLEKDCENYHKQKNNFLFTKLIYF